MRAREINSLNTAADRTVGERLLLGVTKYTPARYTQRKDSLHSKGGLQKPKGWDF